MSDDIDDNNLQSADDALEPDDMFDPLRDEAKLAQDGDSPGAPPSDIHSDSPVSDPETDDGIDPDELYQEGISGATNADNEVVDTDDEFMHEVD